MEAGENLTASPIEFGRDHIKDSERELDPAVYTAARIFNAVALPDNMPDFLKQLIEARAEQAKISAQEAGFVASDANGPMNGNTPEERQKLADEKSRENLTAFIVAEADEQRRREEAHYNEWRQSSHTYAGQTMDGEDWNRMTTWFRDPANVEAWEDAMMAETGQTREEVRQTGGKMKRFYDLMEKDAKGTLTKDERGEFDTLNKDRDVKRGVEVQQEIQGLQQSQSYQLTSHNEATLDGTQIEKAKSFASTLDDDAGLPVQLAAASPLSLAFADPALGKPVAPSVTPAITPPTQTTTVNPDNMFG